MEEPADRAVQLRILDAHRRVRGSTDEDFAKLLTVAAVLLAVGNPMPGVNLAARSEAVVFRHMDD